MMLRPLMQSRIAAATVARALLRGTVLAAAASLTGLLAVTSYACAQQWPTRPVTVIFPYGHGGGDVITRLVVDKVGNRLGQRFIVENRPGAGGVVGTAEVARAAPDGYTLVVSGLGSMILGPLFNKASFDAVKDFTQIAYFGGGPAALVVSNSSKAKTLKEFVELSRRQAGGLSYGTPGRGTLVHLVAEMFRRESGAHLVLIPYKDATHVLSDLAGDQIAAGFLSSAAVLPLVKAGKLRMLATAGEKRGQESPDVPTFVEAGYKDIVGSAWFGLAGPTGVPKNVVTKLNAEVRDALAQPDVQALLRKLAVETKEMDVDTVSRFVSTERDRWGALVRSLESAQK